MTSSTSNKFFKVIAKKNKWLQKIGGASPPCPSPLNLPLAETPPGISLIMLKKFFWQYENQQRNMDKELVKRHAYSEFRCFDFHLKLNF